MDALQQIRELQGQVHHLARSNAELEAYLLENGHDPELRAAIGENIVAIARRQAIIEDLQKLVPGERAKEHEIMGRQTGAPVEDVDMQMACAASNEAANDGTGGLFL
eukprot:CAMPEP_0119376838 /NCGR_PEP_ID=MMETSP1334-20130426/41596_1 /TAXON_ID=127549 /ORGANISM="Calcidiscus leptoporus, Strain RCC1130" /LENGTH=106 /DNA_ID=CAMNT_0007395531 /DNA_START=9 /DNA_END=329 /DNA_ORIENTATION=+